MKIARIEIRLRADEKLRLEREARLANLSLSELVRTRLLPHVRTDVRTTPVGPLSDPIPPS